MVARKLVLPSLPMFLSLTSPTGPSIAPSTPSTKTPASSLLVAVPRSSYYWRCDCFSATTVAFLTADCSRQRMTYNSSTGFLRKPGTAVPMKCAILTTPQGCIHTPVKTRCRSSTDCAKHGGDLEELSTVQRTALTRARSSDPSDRVRRSRAFSLVRSWAAHRCC